MTEMEYGLAEIADALNRLALAIAGLVIILLVMSWSLDDMALRVHLFGYMLRRRDAPIASADQPEAHSTPAAHKAAKDTRSESHAQ